MPAVGDTTGIYQTKKSSSEGPTRDARHEQDYSIRLLLFAYDRQSYLIAVVLDLLCVGVAWQQPPKTDRVNS